MPPLFGKKTAPAQPIRPNYRIIQTLEPQFFESIHNRLLENGGLDNSSIIAARVATAIYNIGSRWLRECSYFTELRNFETLYGNRSASDRRAADKMIDFLITVDRSVQQGEAPILVTLLNRLEDVLSRPA